MNTLTIECKGTCLENVVLTNIDGGIRFGEFWNMSYEEMKSSEALSDFVDSLFDATDKQFDDIDQVIATLIDEDNNFIWSIIIGANDDTLRYCLVDWKKDGKNYRYAPEKST